MTPALTPLGKSDLIIPRLAYGCWRIAESKDPAQNLETGSQAILAAVEVGITLFDLADIYCHGRSEEVFGQVLRQQFGLRERLVIATKCGIRFPGEPEEGAPYRYDLSHQHITRSCEDSLRRLGVETIDLFQLHRPDYLMQPEEVAAAFLHLRDSGKVREFGVSNFNPVQLQALQKACPMPLVVNQVEVSLLQQRALDDGTLAQCWSEKITPLAWSPLGAGLLADGPASLLDGQKEYEPGTAKAELTKVADGHGVSPAAVALAWLLMHPSGIVPIVGSTRPERIRDAATALGVTLSREEWYRLLVAGRQLPLP